MIIHIIICLIVIVLTFIFVTYTCEKNKTEQFEVSSTQDINGYVVTQNENDNWEIKNPDQTFYSTLKPPKGTIMLWGSSSIPIGWSICDGTNGTPDLRGRFVLGNNSTDGQFKSNIGDISTGNLETHTLSQYEMPYHRHIFEPIVVGSYINSTCDCNRSDAPGYTMTSYECNWGSNEVQMSAYSVAPNGYVYADSTGGGKPHNNMPPYYVLVYIMRIT